MNVIEIKDTLIKSVPNIICAHIAGSHAYGMATEHSDLDIRGIFCADRKFTTPFFEQKRIKIPTLEDAELHEISKYIQMYTEANPNIIESLWVNECDILLDGYPYRLLRAYKHELLSKKVAFTFSGYAMSQLNRIKGHNKWINNPQPVEPPKHRDFIKLVQNFTSDKIMPRDFNLLNLDAKYPWSLVHYGGNIFGILKNFNGCNLFTERFDFNVSSKQQKILDIHTLGYPSFIIKYSHEDYLKAKDNHHNYWKWKNNRNEKRSELEELYGYDTKHASHLVRLLRMAEEILNGDGVIVKRPDAQELLDIRNGKYKYEDIVAWAEAQDFKINGPKGKGNHGELYLKSELPHKPDIKLACKLLMEIQDYWWSK